MNRQQHRTTKMESQPKNEDNDDEKNDENKNEEREWRSQLLLAMREMRNEINNKLEDKIESLRSTLTQSMTNVNHSVQTVSDALDVHVHQSEEKHQQLQSSIDRVENRVVSLYNDMEDFKASQLGTNAEIFGNIERLDDDVNGFRRVEDIASTIPEIDDRVNEAVEGLLGNVQFINHNIANDIMNLDAKLVDFEERLVALQREREEPLPLPLPAMQLRLERLESRLQTVDMEQRDTAHSLIATGRHVEAWEETLGQQIRDVAQDVTNLQGMVAEHAEPVPSAGGSLDVADQPPDPNPNSISWFHNSPTPGNTTLLENSFMREVMGVPPRRRLDRDEQEDLRRNMVNVVLRRETDIKQPKLSREKPRKSTGGIKKKRRANSGDDPSSSSSSETELSSSLGPGSNADDHDRSRKGHRQRDDDSDDKPGQRDGAFKSTALGSSNRNRRESIIGDESSTSTSNQEYRGGRRHSESKVIYVQPAPKTDDFRLKEIRIGSVLYFCKAFNNAASQFRGRLNAANFIDERLLSQMKQVAYKEDMPGADGILRNGRQKITNQELFAILAVMCAPTNTHKMQLELSKSCWPKRSEYKAIEDVAKNIANFRIDLLTYVDRFDDKLTLFSYHRKSRKLIPKDVFKKGGGDPGLADYFIGGLPDKNLGLRIWASVDRKKRANCQTFEKFKKYFILAVEAMEARDEDRDVNKQICFGVREMMKNDKTKSPSHSKSKDWVSHRPHNTQRVNQLEEMDTVVSDGDSNEELEVVFTSNDEEKEELPSAIEDIEEKEDNSIITEEDVSELANLLQPPDSKTPGICYDMLYKGKCEKINCPYSHKAEDIEKAKKLKALRVASASKPGNRSVSFNRSTYPATRKA